MLQVIMSDAGAGTSRGGGSQGGGSQGEGQQVDPGRKYGTIVNNNVNHWKCIFCYKLSCKNYMVKRAEERAALAMQFQPAVNEDDVEDGKLISQNEKTMKRKNRGSLDKWFYDALGSLSMLLHTTASRR
uniref:Uncharacterized protein n=1 Tax=Brassica campestris TaxID=3711 RepID=A0A3P5YJU6_BRACM|nr:unnamed protein product [Brassica rapa]